MTLEIVESRLLATLPEAIHRDIEGISRGPFESYPAEIEHGKSSELRWDVSGAAETSKEPDIGSAESAVTMHVFPSETTTYAQVAENDAGSVGATVEVLVERDHVRLNNLDRWIKKLENGDHLKGKGRER